MAETALEILYNRLYKELEDLTDQVQATFVKAQQEGQTNPEIVFKAFIGLRLGLNHKEDE